MAILYVDSGSFNSLNVSGSLFVSGTLSATSGLYIDNLITVGLPGSSVDYNSIKAAVDSITDATAANTYTVQVAPGLYIEDTITVPSYVAVRGDSSISTIVSASNANNGVFIMSDQSMVIDMQIQGSTGTNAVAVLYSSPTTPQTNAIAYVENVRFGTNYTHASVLGVPGGNCILQCSNVKYGGFTYSSNKSFDIGFRVSGSGGGIGRMQLRNVTSTNGGITGSSDQIFALADAPGCTFIVNGCLLTKAVGSASGTGFKVYNGGSLRLTGVNFQRWAKGIWAPQTGSAPSIDAIALNFENCTTDVAIEHSGSTGKIQGTDNFLKTQINLSSSLYEVGQDPRIITVATKGGDFTSISASVAYITDSTANNRYVIQVGPGQFIEKEIDLTDKPYVSIVGSSIQTTQIFPSGSNQHLIKMGVNNEVSFLTLTNAPIGYSALYVDDVGDFAQAHKVSFFDCDTCITVISRTKDTIFYGEYLDYNGTYRTGSFVSSSNGYVALASLENYYQFPINAPGLIANYGTGDAAELDLYTGAIVGELDATSIAVRLENGADLQGSGLDIPKWGTAIYIPNLANSASFNIVGSMIHDSITYDFDIQHPSSSCRFQGTADHSKINTPNTAPNFYWSFLDENDGELDITRNLAVTFADGTHTDASTLIFRGSPMGVMEGGVITSSSLNPNSCEVDITAGFGYLELATGGVYKRVDWAASSSFNNLTDDDENYIYVDSNATILSSITEPNNLTSIILGRVYCANGSVQFIDQSPRNGYHTTNLLSTFNRTALGPVYAEGSIATISGSTSLDVSSGTYFFGENQFNPAGGTAIAFDRYYRDAGQSDNWARLSTTTVPTNIFDSGSNALVALSSSYYTKHTLYCVGDGNEEKYFLVVGQQQFATLVETENAGLPTPPSFFVDGVVSIAAIYVQSGSGAITQIQDIRPVVGFKAAGVNAASFHGNLLGLTNDDHPQYLLVNGTRAMTGPLTASIVSASGGFIGDLTGTASTASYVETAQTASYVLNAVSSSFASTASYIQNAVSASYVLQAVSASFATTASYASTAQTLLGSVTSASYASTASYVENARSASYILGSNVSGNITGNSTNITAYTINQDLGTSNQVTFAGVTSSLFGTAQTASYVLGSNVAGNITGNATNITAYTIDQNLSTTSQVTFGGVTASLFGTATTASYVLNAISSSFATTASYASTAQTLLGSVTSASYASTASFAQSGNGIFSGSFSGSFVGNGSGLTGVTATATPAGSDTQIQYNDNNTFGASSNLTFDNATNQLTVSGSIHVSGSVVADNTETLIKTTSDVVINAGAANALTNITGLTFNYVSGDEYYFLFYGIFTTDASTTGTRWTLSGTNFAQLAYTSEYTLTATTTTRNAMLSAQQLPAASNATSNVSNGGGNFARIEGMLIANGSGTFQIQGAREVTTGTVTLKAGSFLKYKKLT